MKFSSLILFCLFGCTFAKVSYDGYQLWGVRIATKDNHDDLSFLLKSIKMDEFRTTKDEVHILVSPGRQDVMTRHLSKLHLTYRVIVENVQENIDEYFEKISREDRAFSLDQYNTWEDIETFLTGVAASSSIATLESIGKTVEQRDQWIMKFSVGADKPMVWIDCGIHAREWISPASCLYGIDLLANGYGSDPEVTALLDRADVYILPVYNPDGYSFTWTDDRLWRKNRLLNPGGCYGVDLNRNFDSTGYGEAGTNDRECSDTYCGSGPASEVETQNGQAAMAAEASRMIAMFSIHSYSQLFLYPFGYTDSVPPESAELDLCAKAGVDALTAVYGTPYVYGPIATTIYPAAGTTVDYVYELGVTYSYTLELRDEGQYGFQLPEDQITDTATETWAGLFASIACIP